MQLECQACHNPHRKQAPTASCPSCHQKQYARLNGQPAPHQNCLSCHKPHSWTATDSQACRRCHTPLPPSRGHLAGHNVLSCTDCHPLHLWRTQGDKLCVSCHERYQPKATISLTAPQ